MTLTTTIEGLLPKTVSPVALAAGLVGLAALGSVGTALGFEHIGGYAPCPLCLTQRLPYYFAVPACLLAFLLARGGRASAARFLLVLCGLAFVVNAGIGVYHSGVEWHWWPGPDTCAPRGGGDLSVGAGGLLESLRETQVVRCDEAPWRLFGLSFAGYSALISAGLAVVAFFGAFGFRSAGGVYGSSSASQ